MVDQGSSHKPITDHPRRRPPPNYASRRVQFQLLVLVFLIMTVLMLMNEARKPENWQWMWQFQRSTLQDDPLSPPSSQASDNQAPLRTRPERQPAMAAASAEPVVTAPSNPISLRNLLDESLDQSLSTAQLRGWSSVLDNLGQPRRDLVRLGLWHARHGQPLDAEERQRWPDLLDDLTRQWSEYEARARRVVEEDQDQLTEAQRQLCRDVLGALHGRWRRQLSALAALQGAASLPDDQIATLVDLQQVLDERAWQAVEDNTVLRSAEHEAWFRSWELLESPAAQAVTRANSPVSFVQLFSQPDAYRGRVVQVSGTARLGYHIVSRDQRFGIDGYYVVWLRPADGSNAPMVVYLRTVPTGFPQLGERAPGQDGTVLQEKVTVTGVFFKRWLYGSRGGLNLAPLILGRITQWTPPPRAPVDDPSNRVGAMAILYAVLSMALVGLTLAVWVYRNSRWSTRDLVPSARPSSALPPFEEQSVRPTVEESLRRMNREDQQPP
jgi:hypothetical protein